MNFNICEDVSSLGISVAFLAIYNIDNTARDESLYKRIGFFYKNLLQNVEVENIEKESNIIGYRKLHDKAGIIDKSLVASPESLFKLLFKYKQLKPINYIVDTYNYVAIKNRVSIGAHDLDRIKGDVRLCLTSGDESFIPLGKKTTQAVNKGEYCYIDDANEILCRLDCRQCEKTKTSIDTKSCLFIIQGHKSIPTITLESTAKELITLLKPNITQNTEVIMKIL